MVKKIFIFIVIWLFSLSMVAQFSTNMSVYASDISSIRINHTSGHPHSNDRSYVRGSYQLVLDRNSEISYTLHYLNCMTKIDDGIIARGTGKPITNFYITQNDGMTYNVGLVNYRYENADGIQYGTEITEVVRFIYFLSSLVEKNINIPDTVSFEPSEWAKTEVDTAIEKGLVPKWNQIGYRENINRLEVCQLLSNFLEQNGVAYEKSDAPFPDVGDTSITHLHQLEIVNGREDGLFHPYDYVTREEFAKMLFLAVNVVCDENSLSTHERGYVDDADISVWAKESVYALTSLGIFKGNDNSEFCPKNNISKEQVILTLLRAD